MVTAIFAPPANRRRALPHRTTNRFFRLLGATPTKTTGRRRLTAWSTRNRRVTRPREAAEEPQEQAVGGARDPDAAAAAVAQYAEEPQEQAVGAARDPDAAAAVAHYAEEPREQAVVAAQESGATAADYADADAEAVVGAHDSGATAADYADADAEAAVAGKYWAHRHSLFSLYDRGVRMDAEGWYSATPEAVAASQAARAAPGDLVVDAFAGCGGNAIQFAARGCYVIAVEIDPHKVELAKHNARVYGVEDRIQFVVGDFFGLAPFLKADLVFLSPPWGGPSYIQAPIYNLDMLKPKDGYATFQAAQKISPNVIIFLPRTVDIGQVEELSWLSSPPLAFESEENYVGDILKGITAYFGDIARSPSAMSDDEQPAD